jgi:hypothetical protein
VEELKANLQASRSLLQAVVHQQKDHHPDVEEEARRQSLEVVRQ